ncbi:hypothetical protein V8G54_028889 [Vigna mungo]|uniref:Uncharacterized protein n=1 Tax=Vigna mungo TaxID=3915 RepID=A0AAQ3RIL6_VIGMU
MYISLLQDNETCLGQKIRCHCHPKYSCFSWLNDYYSDKIYEVPRAGLEQKSNTSKLIYLKHCEKAICIPCFLCEDKESHLTIINSPHIECVCKAKPFKSGLIGSRYWLAS